MHECVFDLDDGTTCVLILVKFNIVIHVQDKHTYDWLFKQFSKEIADNLGADVMVYFSLLNNDRSGNLRANLRGYIDCL